MGVYIGVPPILVNHHIGTIRSVINNFPAANLHEQLHSYVRAK